MKIRLVVICVAALSVLGLGCGSSETKTVTETVAGAAEEAPPPEEAATPASESEGSATEQPTDSSIPDGTWKLGEYTAGEYRAPGGPRCWWEKLKKLGEESLNYGSEETNILVEIDSPYFKTEDCGVWEKVG